MERRLQEREEAERALAGAEKRFRTAFAEAPIGMALIALDGRFLQVNRALADITGYSVANLLAVPSGELTHSEDRPADELAVAFMRSGTMHVHDVEKRFVQAGGSTAWVSVHTTLIRDERGKPAYFLSQIQDVTARRKYESRLRYMADHDPLTGLLNRRAYERILTEHLARGERYGNEGAVLVIDLDEFKQVNDTLGHNAGDELIARVAKALAERLRDTDTVARLGGDEFAILLPKGEREDAEQVARSLLDTIRAERSARGPKGRARPISASIGVAPLAGAQGISFGLIGDIDRWVVTRAIKMLGEQGRRGLYPKVEINLSGHSLGDPCLAAHIGGELRNAQVDPTQLVFEITETAAIGNIEAAQHFAEQLAELGCRFALDDFGAGFGSFYYLKHLPFDFIKIDGEFVRNLTSDETDRVVIGAVVELARGLNKRTIAEFVGDEATVTVLKELGVDYLQGFHLGKPAPIEAWLPPLHSPPTPSIGKVIPATDPFFTERPSPALPSQFARGGRRPLQ